MPFNSNIFIFAFLPIVALVYFALGAMNRPRESSIWLLLSSLFFYGYYNPLNVLLILSSIFMNYGITNEFDKKKPLVSKRSLLHFGLAFNVILLCFYKYTDFSIWNINALFGTDFSLLNIVLPIGISFFTLQQIAYLVDSFEGLGTEKNFIDYALFVSFFPHLLSGPIVRYQDVKPQMLSAENKKFNPDNFSLGIFIFIIGLSKKVLIADSFASWANAGFNGSASLDFFGAWKTSLCYTFQLYFDFSGYSEMAIGIAQMFNIVIPPNFNSPLRSTNVIDFWGRWHMTLSHFINTYIFTPIVRFMPRINFQNTMIATFLSMTIAGLWHGAGWTFVIYGMLHGAALVVNHVWKKNRKKKKKLPTWLAWFITFNFVNISFVLFRAKDLTEAWNVFKGMMGLSGFIMPRVLGLRKLVPEGSTFIKAGTYLVPDDYSMIVMVLGCFALVKFAKNTLELSKTFEPTAKLAVACSFLFTLSIFGLSRVTEFIYFNF